MIGSATSVSLAPIGGEGWGEGALSRNDSVQSEYPHAKSAKDAKGIGNADFKNNSLKNGASAQLRSMLFAFPLRPSQALRELSSASSGLGLRGESSAFESTHKPENLTPPESFLY